MRKRKSRTLEDRLAALLEPDLNGMVWDGYFCMVWMGYVNPQTGYGQISLCPANQERLGFRQRIGTVPWVVCRLHHGEPPQGHYVLHACGRNLCAEPAHLSWGTPLQNIMDSIAHGTRRTGDRHPNAKYSNAVIAELRARVAGGESAYAIAGEYGMKPPYAYKILRGDVRNYPEPVA